MHPKPKADTSSPPFPSVRFCIVGSPRPPRSTDALIEGWTGIADILSHNSDAECGRPLTGFIATSVPTGDFTSRQSAAVQRSLQMDVPLSRWVDFPVRPSVLPADKDRR